jgi:hypothetical protein
MRFGAGIRLSAPCAMVGDMNAHAVAGIPPPLPVGNTAELTAMNKKHAALDGVDDKAERYALLSLGRQNYFGAFTLLKFGAAWRLRDFRTILAKNPTPGLVEKTTVEEYEARLK